MTAMPAASLSSHDTPARFFLTLVFALGMFLVPTHAAAEAPFDIVIRHGRIIDGAGNPWYAADIGIRDGHIAAIGPLSDAATKHVIDAGGRIVAPGFIDVHTHAEKGIRQNTLAANFLLDGVTSIVTGNCGSSAVDVGAFFRELQAAGTGINIATFVGHNSIRQAVMGDAPREPTRAEMDRMIALVDQAMRDGAVGLSTGLIYVPGTYAKKSEIVALARVAARHGGLYASHMRNEGTEIFAAINEALDIGREARLPVEISHFKITNKLMWDRTVDTLAMVEAARAGGLDVTVDQYPYTSSSSTLDILLPVWALERGGDALRARIADPDTRRKIAAAMKDSIRYRHGRDDLAYATVARFPAHPAYEGLAMPEVSRRMGRTDSPADQIESFLDLLANGGGIIVYDAMKDADVERVMRCPYTMAGSDGSVVEFGEGTPHPRSYGANARILGHYVRELGVLRLEEAVRKMTSLPAQRFHLPDRGLLRPQAWADIVIFDPATVTDCATFAKPHAYSIGFSDVLVNGVPVVEQGRLHGDLRPGRMLTSSH